MGLLRKFLECLGFEDKEALRAQFDSLYHSHEEYEGEEIEALEESEPEVVVDVDPVVAEYERLIRISEDDAERADLEARLKRYKRTKERGGYDG